MDKPIFDFEINDCGHLQCRYWDNYETKTVTQNGRTIKQYYLRTTKSQRKIVDETEFDKVLGGHYVTFTNRPDIAFVEIERSYREKAEIAHDEWCKSLEKVLTIWEANGLIGGTINNMFGQGPDND